MRGAEPPTYFNNTCITSHFIQTPSPPLRPPASLPSPSPPHLKIFTSSALVSPLTPLCLAIARSSPSDILSSWLTGRAAADGALQSHIRREGDGGEARHYTPDPHLHFALNQQVAITCLPEKNALQPAHWKGGHSRALPSPL